MVLLTTFMFPCADERRLRIIAVMMIMYFVFDGRAENEISIDWRLGLPTLILDKIEETHDEKLAEIKEEFFAYFKYPEPSTFTTTSSDLTSLQGYMVDTMKRTAEFDNGFGNGGGQDIFLLC